MSEQLSKEQVEQWLYDYLDALRKADVEDVASCFADSVTGSYNMLKPFLSGKQAIRNYWSGFFEYTEALRPQFEIWGVNGNEAIAMVHGDCFWNVSNMVVTFNSVMRLRLAPRPQGGHECIYFESWHALQDS